MDAHQTTTTGILNFCKEHGLIPIPDGDLILLVKRFHSREEMITYAIVHLDNEVLTNAIIKSADATLLYQMVTGDKNTYCLVTAIAVNGTHENIDLKALALSVN